MPSETSCPVCGRPIRLPDDLLATGGKCPNCQANIASPEPDPPPAPPVTYAIREPDPPPLEAPQAIREDLQPAHVDALSPRLPKPMAFDDEEDDDDDDEAMERYEERRRERQRETVIKSARSKVAIPAIGLMVFAGFALLGVVVATGIALWMLVDPSAGGPGNEIFAAISGGFAVAELFFGIMVLVGALRMKKMRSYGLAIAASIFAILNGLGACVFGAPGILLAATGLIFGIWGIIVLCLPDVRLAFADEQRRQLR